MFAIYDKKAEIYDTPLFFLKEVQAHRWFYTLVQQAEGRFQHFKDDMELHKIAQFNVTTGKIKDTEPEKIMEGKQIILGKETGNNENSNGA